ncbi:exodeoxyribonuclease VII large subunit [Prevotella sp. E13-17]|uniref:exodeoxyribonuclease VII large subunit n=1 Tax=Prevotella sp. E13-17 TaxID=2913616 RepID=UPI001EDA0E4C|nr:exodeoxyribonuclease VII large subunit [Prevotella sp. E13-17]UKK51625.1 exodeoxyribonuclease VII large subunit [Prevotella sp. E13-17]
MTTFTLYELNSLVRQAIENAMDQEYWVEAELSECRESRGHCYMELIQKDERSNTPVARASAKCWKNTWGMLQPHFERITGQPLHAGLKVRLKVYAQFHEAFGFSWIVTDIDPTYTLGDMAQRRQEIIRKLKEEGIFDLQKELTLSPFALNIAVISSETAAGYGDFVNQLADTPFAFRTQLFPAIMQGEQVEQSIITALNAIYQQQNELFALPFDCVVIIRGGGATADLSGFDTLTLAENVANFPLPIITGIGHDRDESVLDMVSHTRVKTPTAAAQFLISNTEKTQHHIEQYEERIAHFVKNKIEVEQLRLANLSERIPPLFSLTRAKQETLLERHLQAILSHLQRRFEKEEHRLDLLEQKVTALDPTLLLKRGYSMTLHKGKLLRDPSQVKSNDELVTRLEKGTIISIVK